MTKRAAEVSTWGVALLSCSLDLAEISKRLAGIDQRRAARSVALLARRANVLGRDLMKTERERK